MAKYIKRPVEVEAVRWDRKNASEIKAFCGDDVEFFYGFNSYLPRIKTLEGNMNVSEGDYIIKGVAGEFYPCKPDIFHKTYQESMTNKERVALLNDLYIAECGMDDNETFYIHLLPREHEKNTLQRIGALPEVIEENVKIDEESTAEYIDLVPIIETLKELELDFNLEEEEFLLQENKFFVSFTISGVTDTVNGNGVIFYHKKLTEMKFEDIGYIHRFIAGRNCVNEQDVILTNIIEMGGKDDETI